MAPTAPAPRKRVTARQKALARLADPTLPRKTHRADNAVTDAFLNSKKDKRLIKHSAFVSRIHKAQPAAAARKPRRPSKKLVATLEDMADALDDVAADMQAGGAMDAAQAKQGRVRHHSLKSRPGAQKRKERLVRGEMQRFGYNLAQLANVQEAPAAVAAPAGQVGSTKEVSTAQATDGSTAATPPVQSTSSRWAALRGFIASTMEQNPAFMTNP